MQLLVLDLGLAPSIIGGCGGGWITPICLLQETKAWESLEPKGVGSYYMLIREIS